MKKFISLINSSIPFGRALNALAHTAVGIGHWIPAENKPNIMVVFADVDTIYRFRQEAHKLQIAHPDEVVCSEFTNTMTVGLTEECLACTRKTPESELVYYASSICADETLLSSANFSEIISRCKRLKDYTPVECGINKNNFTFRDQVELPDYKTLPIHKISLVLDRARAPWELVNATVTSSLSIGQQAELKQLRLLIYVDANEQKHTYISYHAFPILANKQKSKFNDLCVALAHDNDILKEIVKSEDGDVIAACLLGTEEQVSTYTRQRYISLWSTELPEDAFE